MPANLYEQILPVVEEEKDLYEALDSYMVDAVNYTTEKGHATVAEQSRWFKKLPPVLMLQQNVRSPLKRVHCAVRCGAAKTDVGPMCSESSSTWRAARTGSSTRRCASTPRYSWTDISSSSASRRPR